MSKAVIDIETDSLTPTKIHVLVIQNVDTQEIFTYTSPPKHGELSWITEVIGHNIIAFDLPVLQSLWGVFFHGVKVTDTLVLSRMLWFSIPGGHSAKAWGERLKFPKLEFNEFSTYSDKMLSYCINDVELTLRIYQYLSSKLKSCEDAVETEHTLAQLCVDMSTQGMPFKASRARRIKSILEKHIEELDTKIQQAFPPKVVCVGEMVPSILKSTGELRTSNLKWYDGDGSFSAGSPLSRIVWEPFNPNSPKQICERLHQVGWKPTDKTEGHKEAKTKEQKEKYKVVGWKINETNLATLPSDAPEGAKVLVRRLMLETRVRKLNEWLSAYNERTGCIHGDFNSIGAWTQRMSHTNPNMANISAAKSLKYHEPSLNKEVSFLGGMFRSLWKAPNDKMLVGVDADGIQLRIFANYIGDEEFIKALVSGSSKNGTDAHTMNMKALGSVCATRDKAKTFIYAFLLGASAGKVAEIFNCSLSEAKQAIDSFIKKYPGLKTLKEETIPSLAAQGFFRGLDNRPVMCDDAHLMLAGFLQNGEKIIMSRAVVQACKEIKQRGLNAHLVNFVHDEMIFLVDNNKDLCYTVKTIAENAITDQGNQLKLRCPMLGNGKIGKSWYDTH